MSTTSDAPIHGERVEPPSVARETLGVLRLVFYVVFWSALVVLGRPAAGAAAGLQVVSEIAVPVAPISTRYRSAQRTARSKRGSSRPRRGARAAGNGRRWRSCCRGRAAVRRRSDRSGWLRVDARGDADDRQLRGHAARRVRAQGVRARRHRAAAEHARRPRAGRRRDPPQARRRHVHPRRHVARPRAARAGAPARSGRWISYPPGFRQIITGAGARP